MGRRVTMGVLTLLLGFEVAATSGWAEEESAVDNAGLTEKLPARSFNSKLGFKVWVVVEESEDSKFMGSTPADEPLAVPACRSWFVEPVPPIDMEAVAGEVGAQGIPGLKLPAKASDADLAHLKDLRALQTLDLFHTEVTNAGLAHLRELKGLQRLRLHETGVGDAGLAHLKDLKVLEYLSLGWTLVRNAGLAHFRELKALQTRYLSCTRVADAGLAQLKHLEGLETLDLRATRVTDAGVEELRKSLPHTEILK